MTVKELIAELQKLPQDITVYISQDAEGNGYSEIASAYTCPTVGEGRDLHALADEDVDTYIAEGETVTDVVIIYPY